jgi:hypothetical protein
MKIIIEAVRGGPVMKDTMTMKLRAMRGEMPRCEFSANMAEVTVAELLLMAVNMAYAANKVFTMLLGSLGGL